ncbi:hypothetical protein JQ594_15460 [Bradyrhizobium manausense]|uniref:hypothetical protein n=1 Tax=Bradyrhizobium manausense TaxID=989370 RepID=UPI001BAA4DD2|nr:hypothetical protein [Bradyrhizobium manausense]MBR0687328.1 hypothetical protein [Bradyrhizobium manausense]
MKPPAKSTLFRMRQTAQLAAETIEIAQDARVRDGEIKHPMPDQVRKRDDYLGTVRLIDAVLSSQAIIDLLKQRMSAMEILATDIAAPAAEEGEEP